jgi:uncharacterized protein (TIGR03086 family)
MDIIELLDEGYGWTAERVAAVRPEDLDLATPCTRWDLRRLLNHMLGASGVVTDAALGVVVTPSRADPEALAATDRIGEDPTAAFDAAATTAMTVWHTPGVLERTCSMASGATPALVVANINLLDVVVHGWDIAQATGEAAQIPPRLAEPILGFARQAITEEQRRRGFAAEMATGDTASDRLVAFLGRKP